MRALLPLLLVQSPSDGGEHDFWVVLEFQLHVLQSATVSSHLQVGRLGEN